MRSIRSLLPFACVAIAGAALAMPVQAQSDKAGGKSGAKPVEKVNFRLDWRPGGQHSPFYLGRERGYFAAEGIDLNIVSGSGSSDSIKQAGTRAVEIAIIDGLAMVQAAEQRVPIKSIAAYYQRSPMIVMSPKSKPVTEPRQLLGDVRLGSPKGSAVFQGLQAMLFANNIKIEQIKMVDIGFGVQPLLVKQVDAMMAYANVQPLQAEAAGLPVHELYVSDHGVNAYGLVIGANEKFLKEKPQLAAGFLRAMSRSVSDAVKDRAAAIAAVGKSVSELNAATEAKALERTLPFWTGPGVEFGTQTEARWTQTIDTAKKVGLVEKAPAAKAVFMAVR